MLSGALQWSPKGNFEKWSQEGRGFRFAEPCEIEEGHSARDSHVACSDMFFVLAKSVENDYGLRLGAVRIGRVTMETEES